MQCIKPVLYLLVPHRHAAPSVITFVEKDSYCGRKIQLLY